MASVWQSRQHSWSSEAKSDTAAETLAVAVRFSGMDDVRSTRLLALAKRCLDEFPNRRLDSAIYCAIHNAVNVNTLDNDKLLEARDAGEILLENRNCVEECGWIEAPPYTEYLKAANTLLPDGQASMMLRPLRSWEWRLRMAIELSTIKPGACYKARNDIIYKVDRVDGDVEFIAYMRSESKPAYIKSHALLPLQLFVQAVVAEIECPPDLASAKSAKGNARSFSKDFS